jgi:hypothetical protein
MQSTGAPWQASKQASKQSNLNALPSKQASKQATKQASKQSQAASKQASGQASKHTGKPPTPIPVGLKHLWPSCLFPQSEPWRFPNLFSVVLGFAFPKSV